MNSIRLLVVASVLAVVFVGSNVLASPSKSSTGHETVAVSANTGARLLPAALRLNRSLPGSVAILADSDDDMGACTQHVIGGENQCNVVERKECISNLPFMYATFVKGGDCPPGT
jgi:hypothetical protein